MKKEIIRNFILITIVFIVLIAIITVIAMISSLKNLTDSEYYELGNDKIPSISSIVGNRNLYKYKSYSENDISIEVYKYNNVKNVSSDLSSYTLELKNNYNFVYTSDIDLTNSSGKLSLSCNSLDDDEIIIIEIEYNIDEYTITIKKGKGNIISI